MNIKQSLLESFKSDNEKIAFYFSASICDCFLLKTLLLETKNQIVVYYFDKSKYQQTSQWQGKEQESTLKILKFYQANYRNFNFQEIQLSAQGGKYFASNWDNLFCHISILGQLYQELSGFDYYLISQNQHFFSQPLNPILLAELFKKQSLNIKLLTPFANFSIQEISPQILAKHLAIPDINFDKIYLDNQALIDAFKAANGKENFENFYQSQSDWNSIYYYLLFFCSIDLINKFLEKFGDKINREIYIHTLSNLVILNSLREDLITYSVSYGKISDDEINQILINFINNFAGQKDKTDKSKIDQVDYFFRLYGDKITNKTIDILMWNSFKWVNYYDQLLLEKLIDFGGNVGELLIKTIELFVENAVENSATILLDKYSDKIHQLQLDEALLAAFERKLYNLCHKLIKCGANKKILHHHKSCYGFDLWHKEISADIKIRPNTNWHQRDKVLISFLLKELGNPENKVPPVIHVTGSNGKGSICGFLQSILQENGYLVHRFTSPAIIRHNENFIVANQEIADPEYYQYLKEVKLAFDLVIKNPDFKKQIAALDEKGEDYSDWVFTVPATMLAFSRNKADLTIIEVITGGENCLTNIFDQNTTIATIINTIIYGDNHAKINGFENIENVANTKSRLAKNNVPIICGKQEDAVLKIISKNAQDRNCPLLVLDQDFSIKEQKNNFVYEGFKQKITIKKTNEILSHQAQNLALAISAILITKKFKIEKIANPKINNLRANQIFKYDKTNIALSWGKQKFAIIAQKNLLDAIYPDHKKILMFIDNYGESATGCIFAYKSGNYQKYYHIKNSTKNGGLFFRILQDEGIKLSAQNKSLSSAIVMELGENIIHINSDSELFGKALKLFQLIKQPNFKTNLQFAKKHSLLTKEQIALMQ